MDIGAAFGIFQDHLPFAILLRSHRGHRHDLGRICTCGCFGEEEELDERSRIVLVNQGLEVTWLVPQFTGLNVRLYAETNGRI